MELHEQQELSAFLSHLQVIRVQADLGWAGLGSVGRFRSSCGLLVLRQAQACSYGFILGPGRRAAAPRGVLCLHHIKSSACIVSSPLLASYQVLCLHRIKSSACIISTHLPLVKASHQPNPRSRGGKHTPLLWKALQSQMGVWTIGSPMNTAQGGCPG